MSYNYNAIPPFRELFDCPSYYKCLSSSMCVVHIPISDKRTRVTFHNTLFLIVKVLLMSHLLPNLEDHFLSVVHDQIISYTSPFLPQTLIRVRNGCKYKSFSLWEGKLETIVKFVVIQMALISNQLICPYTLLCKV
jgi:hypothetical protein